MNREKTAAEAMYLLQLSASGRTLATLRGSAKRIRFLSDVLYSADLPSLEVNDSENIARWWGLMLKQFVQ